MDLILCAKLAGKSKQNQAKSKVKNARLYRFMAIYAVNVDLSSIKKGNALELAKVER